MDSIFLLIPIAVVFTAVAVWAFFWAVNNKQYDDLDAAGQSILFDDEPAPGKASASGKDKVDD